ncbi:phage holin family protein [Spongisporangium articulatum]|uniref:Phage holin family protein n=1 Tax=Spongisporangium articulatum TaxID=3362603 RepID=A0ABW8AIU1_9ACTN
MPEERTLGQLVTEASEDLSALVRYEIALAKAEVKDDVVRGAVGGAMFVAAGTFAFFSLITLLVTAGYGLHAAGLSEWLSFLIITVVLLLLAGIVAGLGVLQLKKIRPPEKAITSTKATLAAVRGRKAPTTT